ncbi:MAG: hypothetical protein U0441_11985 [Polyangiaceae bacterium]
MANNFHDRNGWLVVGFDVHEGIQFFPFLPVLIGPVPFLEINAVHPFIIASDHHSKTYLNGIEGVKDGHETKLLWPHFPVAPTIFNLTFALDLAFGSQKCWLPRLSVLAEGSPMTATAITGPVSVNMDCFLFTKVPSSAILQPGTVETTPSLTDYAYGIGRAVVEAAFDFLFHRLEGPSKEWEDFFPGAGGFAKAFLGNLMGRILPFSWDPGSGFSSSVGAALGWDFTATGSSPAALIGAVFDRLGITPPGTEGSGLTWKDIVGSPLPLGEDDTGQATSDAGIVLGNLLKNLFPSL